jgi:hypothetical protein
LVRPLVSEPARDSEPDRDLNSEDLSTKPEARDREPDRDLARPLVSEATTDSDPDRDLNRELFSAKLEDEPIEALKFSV